MKHAQRGDTLNDKNASNVLVGDLLSRNVS
jgi:hypothetical protein